MFVYLSFLLCVFAFSSDLYFRFVCLLFIVSSHVLDGGWMFVQIVLSFVSELLFCLLGLFQRSITVLEYV